MAPDDEVDKLDIMAINNSKSAINKYPKKLVRV